MGGGCAVCVLSLSIMSNIFATPVDCSPPGYGIFQARILEWAAISSSRGSSQPRDQTHISCISCIGRWILYHHATGKPRKLWFKGGQEDCGSGGGRGIKAISRANTTCKEGGVFVQTWGEMERERPLQMQARGQCCEDRTGETEVRPGCTLQSEIRM